MSRKLAAVCTLLAGVLVATASDAVSIVGSADNIAYIPVHQMGYTGKDVYIGIIDGGFPRSTHRTFYVSDDNHDSRVVRTGYYNGVNGVTGHATGVAHHAAGRGKGGGDEVYLGVAPEAYVWAASVSTGASFKESDMRQAYLDFSTPDASGNRCYVFAMAIASTTQADCGLFTFDAFMDYLAHERDVVAVFGAVRAQGSVGWPAGTYNSIVVGGVTADLTAVFDGSGIGPTPDGRSKPEIVAPASKLYVAGHGGDDDWYQNPGSYVSGAVPFVAGAAALLQQYAEENGYTWDPRVAKAVLLNSAEKLAGWTHTDTQPLDNAQGAGLLNCLAAIRQFAAGEQGPGTVDPVGWDLGHVTGTASSVYTLNDCAPVGSWITATLAWYRYADATDDNLLGHNWVVGMNNLDLYLVRESDCTVVAQSVSTIDSVEHIVHQVNDEDRYVIVVDLVGSGALNDDYGLAWSTAIPEPATMALVGMTFAAAAVWRRRRRR